MREILIIAGVCATSVLVSSAIYFADTEKNWEQHVKNKNRIIDQRIDAQSRMIQLEANQWH